MRKIIPVLLVLLFTLSVFSTVSYSQERKEDYKVKSGDILWNIAKKTLKKHTLWPAIWEANSKGIVNKEKFNESRKKAVINPNLIYPKQILAIPNVKSISPEKLKSASNIAKQLRKTYKKNGKYTKTNYQSTASFDYSGTWKGIDNLWRSYSITITSSSWSFYFEGVDLDGFRGTWKKEGNSLALIDQYGMDAGSVSQSDKGVEVVLNSFGIFKCSK